MRGGARALGAVTLVLAGVAAAADGPPPAPRRSVHVVATSHLDTQWRWTIQDTISSFLPHTLRDNFALLDKYPGYTFSFEGAFRYSLAKEYYPAEFERLKGYVKAGRWKVAGSWLDAVDTNIPSPESLIRQALYGNGFFRRELGVTSRDVFLPDCFGFGAALPSIAAHSGLDAFSTQKLTWRAAMKIPFDLGLWEGVDGSSLVAALNPGDYASEIKTNLTLDPDLYATVDRQAALSGLPVAFKYFGTGDVGIAPLEPSVALLQESLEGPGPLKVSSEAPDELARELVASGDVGRLQRYKGELLLSSHGAGCYTSQAAMKRYNRKNERLADAAEKAAVIAAWLGGPAYPREALREAWTRFLVHQFHDDLTGTSIPEAYVFSWNDEAIAANQLTDILNTSAAAVSSVLGSEGTNATVPVVVFNPLAIAREDVVEAKWDVEADSEVHVWGPDGREVPAQAIHDGREPRIAFLAAVPPLSFAVFQVAEVFVSPAVAARVSGSELAVTERSLENARYRVRLDDAGDVTSIFDKRLGRELLSAPLELQLIDDEPKRWAAWEVEYSALSAPPRQAVGGPARVRVVEKGPARVALEVVRRAAGSVFVQRLSLAAGGAGDRLELLTDVDWSTPGTLLKAAFPLAAGNSRATYDLGLGTIERETNRPNLYEVPAQEWADVTDTTGTWGVTIVNDSRYGWDRPDGKTLRLSLVHTPRVVEGWRWLADQASNDIGHHRVLMALEGHAGDWRSGRAPQLGDRLNQPLMAWQGGRHRGPLNESLSLLRLEGRDGTEPPVAVRAVKRAEDSDEVVVRLQELSGRALDGVRLRFAAPVTAVREVNGAEEPVGPGTFGGAEPPAAQGALELEDGVVTLAFAPYRPRTLALRLGVPPATISMPEAVSVELPYDLDGISTDDDRGDGDFDGEGHSISSQLLPATFVSGGMPFRTGPRGKGEKNVVVCRGQRVEIPAGGFSEAYIVAASVAGDRTAAFGGATDVRLRIQDWAEPVGQWDSRLGSGTLVSDTERMVPGYTKPAPVAWVGTHRHERRGADEPYVLTQLFRYRVPLGQFPSSVTLPDDENLRLVAMTVRRGGRDQVEDLTPDTELRRPAVHINAPDRVFTDRLKVTLTTPYPAGSIRYTLDGSTPTVLSQEYREPIVLNRTTTVTADALLPGGTPGANRASPSSPPASTHPTIATFTKLELYPAAVPTAALSPGLACRLYLGDWKKLPDFTRETPTRSFTMSGVGLPPELPREHFGLVCEGYLDVPVGGLHTLAMRAEDGGELWLDGKRLIVNDLIDFIPRRAETALAKGLHPVEIRYFQRDFVSGLELMMDSPTEPLAAVPPERLKHREVPQAR
jgi:alpha-mannosidase